MNPSNSRARLCFEFLEHRVAPVVGLDPSVSVDDSSVWVGPPQLQPILAPGYEPSPVKPMADLNGDGDDDILTVDGSRLTVVSGGTGRC